MTLPYLDELKKHRRFNECYSKYVLYRLDMHVKVSWLCSMGWSSRVYYDVTRYYADRERYNLETVPNMKRMCKQNGIKGYSKLRSPELAKKLMSI